MTECKVWNLHQARCRLCDWSSEVTGISADAAFDARDHRRSPEHRQALRDAAAERNAR